MKKLFTVGLSVVVGLCMSITALAESSGRQLEEVVVTAERQEASISDTSISISAFTSEQIAEFGLRDQADLQNLVPATVILPYDAAIRGVGRNFRSLGGDPGISTYINGVYSEDLYTATIQSFWDIDRVEILRGPQGTLYGRNAIGGAMNFIHKRPTQEFEASFKTVVGNHDMVDFYGAISGPLIEDTLAGRFTWTNRERDGYVKDLGGGPDLDSRGEENYAVQLNWTPRDDLEFNIRTNKITVHRVMGGGDGGGAIVFFGENADGSRNYTRLVNGYRRVDPAQTDPRATNYLDPSMEVFNFTNPSTGEVVPGQYRRAGVDVGNVTNGQSNAFNRIAEGFGETASPWECVFIDKDSIDGDDLCAFTNGHNLEDFEQTGMQFDVNWDISDTLSMKYIFGTSRYSYERITDDDSSRSTVRDNEFYVNHEMQHDSHEIQAFYDINDNISVTSGVFWYIAKIDQRGDFFDTTQDGNSLYAVDASNDPFHFGSVFPDAPTVGLFSARNCRDAIRLTGSCTQWNGAVLTEELPEGTSYVEVGPWSGDDGNGWSPRIKHGPETAETYLEYGTRSKRRAWAAYTQGVWDINDEFTLTLGLRYAEDDFRGQENLVIPTIIDAFTQATQGIFSSAALGIGDSTLDGWANFNILRGAIDAETLQPTGVVDPWVDGFASYVSVHRNMERVDEKTTLRINLDWTPNDRDLWYFSATSGYRSGGFNLVFFSATHTYDPEELIAYEIGYKGQFLNDTLQVFASTYLYDYENIHTFGSEVSPATGGTTTSVLEAPGAEIYGFEAEILWLATDSITVGGNVSFTPSEYTETLLIQDAADPRFPDDLIPNQDTNLDIKGNRVLQVPDYKGSAFVTWDKPMGDRGDFSLTFSASWISEVYFSQFETDLDRAPAYERYDLRGTWMSPNKNWIVTGFVHNLLDEVGIRQIEPHGSTDGYRRTGQVTEPQLYGLEVTWNLN